MKAGAGLQVRFRMGWLASFWDKACDVRPSGAFVATRFMKAVLA